MEVQVPNFTLNLIIACTVLALLLAGLFWIGRLIKKANPQEIISPFIAILFVPMLLCYGLLSFLNGMSLEGNLPSDNSHEKYAEGVIVEIELLNKDTASLLVRDQDGVGRRIPLYMYNELPYSPLKTGLRVRFPTYYKNIDVQGFFRSKALITWRPYFNEENVGSPPLAFLNK